MRKKVFSLLAIGFFMGSSLNLNALDSCASCCFRFADQMATEIGNRLVLSHRAEYDVFVYLYDTCMDAT